MDLSNLIVDQETSVLNTMQVFNSTGKQIAIIAPGNKLTAVVTDGDIRRHIVRGGSLNDPVGSIANYHPISVRVQEKERAKEIMQQYSIMSLPVINDDEILIAVLFANDLEITNERRIDAPVVIMAGGLGTRLDPYTKILPKPLIPIGDLPIIEHIIHRFLRYDCQDFHLIVNYKKNMIKSYFSETEHFYSVDFVDEVIPLGTGGGLSLLKGKITEPFFLSNCDILVDADYASVYHQHQEQHNIITMVCAFKHVTIPYGVVELDGNGRIQTMSEKPQFSFLSNTGLYLVEPRVVEEMKDNETIGFPEIIEKYRGTGENIGVYPVNEKCWMDMGQFEELEHMKKTLGV